LIALEIKWEPRKVKIEELENILWKLEGKMTDHLNKFFKEWILIEKWELWKFSKELWDTKELNELAEIFVKPLTKDFKMTFDKKRTNTNNKPENKY
jgi:hypothetical protein